MRAGPASCSLIGQKPVLVWILSVFVSHTKTRDTKTIFKFPSRQGKYSKTFHVVADLLLQTIQRESYRALVFSRLSLSGSTDHRDHNLYSLSHPFQSSCT